MGEDRQRRLIGAFVTTEGRLRAHVLGVVVSAFDRLGSWRDADVARFVATVVPIIAGAQRQVGSLADAYLAAMLADMLTADVRRTGAGLRTDAQLRGGVEPAVVYARPLQSVWKALADGKDLAAALEAGRQRAVALAATDLQLAKTHAMRDLLADNKHIVGYRRVLTGSHSCGLCVVASTQRYHKAELMPIHPSCDCAVAPIVGDHDPGQVVNEPLLEGTHAAIRDRFGAADAAARGPADYRDLLVTHTHGEIGPILARRGDTFTGPDDLGGR